MRAIGPLLFGLATALATPITARAQVPEERAAQAQAYFDEGLALMKANHHAEACPKLAQSQELDPGAGTKYRLAECYEGMGKLATAWSLYLEVADESKKAGRTDREEQARQHADAIRPRLPKLAVTVPASLAGLAGLVVTRDGVPVDRSDHDREVAVDPGAHVIAAGAPGRKPWQVSVTAEEGRAAAVSVPELQLDGAGAAPAPAPVESAPAVPESPPAAPPSAPPTRATPASAGSGQRVAAVVAGAAGAIGLGLGVGFGLKASSQWNDALSHCAGGDTQRCDDEGVALGSDASGSAAISTIGFAIGGVGLVAAGVLWFTAPSGPRDEKSAARWSVTPAIGPGGASGVLRGRF